MTRLLTLFSSALAALAFAACSAPDRESAIEGKAVVVESWRPFSDDSPWNTPIAESAAIDPKSTEYMAALSESGAWFINIDEWSVPVYQIDSSITPTHRVLDLYPGEIGRGFEKPREIPIPANAVAGLPKGGTGYLAVVDRERSLAWDMRGATKREDGHWYIGFGAVTNLRGTGTKRPWNLLDEPASARTVLPSGFPLLAGLIRVEEIKAGRIDHALVFSSPSVMPDRFVPPAAMAGKLTAEGRTDGLGLPLGARIQLDPEWDVDGSGLTREGKIIARALQRHGAYLADHAGANVFFAESSPDALKQWDGVLAQSDLQFVFTPEMIAENFRVIELGDVLSGQPMPASAEK